MVAVDDADGGQMGEIRARVPHAYDHDHGSTRPRHGGSILMAAMLGLADAMGREPEPIDVVEVADAELGIDELRLKFGDLRPLDWRDQA